MSIEINTKKVAKVLLSDGKWRSVMEGSFEVGDAWPWQENGETTGAMWLEAKGDGEREVFCPLSSIRAVAYAWDSSPKE